MEFFLPSNILMLCYQNAASRVQGCVHALPVPKDEIGRGLFHRVVQRSRAGAWESVTQSIQKQGHQWGEAGHSMFRVAWVLDCERRQDANMKSEAIDWNTVDQNSVRCELQKIESG